MPADIRNFFGGKGASSSQDKVAPPKLEPKKSSSDLKSKPRRKRAVVTDSDEDEELSIPPKTVVTPKKAAPKKAVKPESPKGEETNASDYFGKNGKSKPSRSETTKTRGSAVKKDSTPAPQIRPSPKTTPKPITNPTNGSNGRGSARKSARKSYVEKEESDDDFEVIKEDDDSGEDIFGAEYKRGGKKMEDDYESDNDAVETIRPSKPKSKASAALTVTLGDRKRKVADLEEDEDDAASAKKTKKVSSTRKPRTPSKKAPELEDKQMQDIFDSVPLVRAPTPPARDPNKKFNFKDAAARSTAAPMAGSKDIPDGAENCLAGLTFVFTGVLEAIDREEGQALVKRYGGKITTAPSSKTSFVVLGSDAGPKKLETIAKFGLKTINEDGLFDLIRKLPANGGSGKAAAKHAEKQASDEKKIKEEAEKLAKEEKRIAAEQKKAEAAAAAAGKPIAATKNLTDDLWTVRYAPTSTSQICGNKAQVDRLQNWLRNWRKNAKRNFKVGGSDGSGLYRAAMLSGGPGIGKTTAAHLVAKMEGYDIVETNASDTRSKKLVEGGLKGVLDTTSLLGYFAGDGKKVEEGRKNLVLIMDEVDGMSAGDRGGVGALAAICKKTSIPIILICNDRQLPKMKPFDGCTYPLKFSKPTTDQVRGRIMTILYREGMKDLIPKTALDAIIEGSRSDIRQIINMISTAKLDEEAMSFDDSKKMSNAWEKHTILRPWDIVQKILGGGMFASSSKSTLNDKIELYFNDHEFSSLMLQENYLGTQPILAQQYSGKDRSLKLLELVDKAAESISDGDLVDRMIHGSQQQWSLMPAHAVFSFVRPASFVSGSLAGGRTAFTAYLGNMSKTGRLTRLVKDIQAHMRLRASADRHDIRQQYLPVLWQRIVKGLELHGEEAEEIDEIIELMDSYFLTKEDWDSIYELGLGPCSEESLRVKPSVKAAFTRKYNAASHPLPFMKSSSVTAPAKKAKDKPDLEEAIEESDEGELLAEPDKEEEDEELDLKKDKYVSAPKKKKAAPKKAAKKSKGKVEEENEESEEDVKPKPKAKAGAGKAKVKK